MMKMLSFVAGIATGFLLNEYLAQGHAARGQGAATDAAGDMGGDADRPVNWLRRTDPQVRERIVSQLGRTIRNPEAVQVDVNGGCVTLRGSVQARDAVLLMTEVENTAGVNSVRNELNVEGSMDEVAPPMMGEAPAVRADERATGLS